MRNKMKFTPLGKAMKEMSLRGWSVLANEFGVGALIINAQGQTMTLFHSGLARLGNHLGKS